MVLDDAKAVCATQSSARSWEYVRAHRQSFIWSDDEDPVGAWNRLSAAALGAVTVKLVPGREGSLQLSFRDRIVEVQLQQTREDRFRLLHGLSRVLRPEADLRLCRDSTHSSDVAFFAMPSADWSDLGSKLGADRVAEHFLSMDSPFEEFLRVAFPGPVVSKGTLASDLTNWEGGSSYRPNELEYIVVYEGPGQPCLDALRAIVHRYLEKGTVTVSFWQTSSKLNIDRDALVEAVADRIGKIQIRVSNSTQTGFVVVERSGVAAGWRTDGRRPQDVAPRKWWQFRK